MDNSPKYRIGMAMSAVLVFVALFTDIIGLIPGVETVASTIFWACAGFYFWTKGMGFFSGRKIAVTAVSWITSLIPILQWLPGLTVGIIAILVMTRIEDRTGISLHNGASKTKNFLNVAGRREPPARVPLYDNGSRGPNEANS